MCVIYNHVYILYRKVEVKLSRETRRLLRRRKGKKKMESNEEEI